MELHSLFSTLLHHKTLSKLNVRQLGILTHLAATNPTPQTVRGMSAELKINKPSVSRSLDTLGELDLIRRDVDKKDARSVLVTTTAAGRKAVTAVTAAMSGGAPK
jgi:DNA-binding MarR family transcriptional regulator